MSFSVKISSLFTRALDTELSALASHLATRLHVSAEDVAEAINDYEKTETEPTKTSKHVKAAETTPEASVTKRITPSAIKAASTPSSKPVATISEFSKLKKNELIDKLVSERGLKKGDLAKKTKDELVSLCSLRSEVPPCSSSDRKVPPCSSSDRKVPPCPPSDRKGSQHDVEPEIPTKSKEVHESKPASKKTPEAKVPPPKGKTSDKKESVEPAKPSPALAKFMKPKNEIELVKYGDDFINPETNIVFDAEHRAIGFKMVQDGEEGVFGLDDEQKRWVEQHGFVVAETDEVYASEDEPLVEAKPRATEKTKSAKSTKGKTSTTDIVLDEEDLPPDGGVDEDEHLEDSANSLDESDEEGDEED